MTLISSEIIKLQHQDTKTAKQIHEIFQASYQIEADLIGTDNFPPLKRTSLDIENSTTEFYAYVKEGVIAAVTELLIEGSHLHIQSLVVHPDYFRQGIGRRLVDFSLKHSKPKTAMVETAVVNKPAIRLYEKAGFIEETRYMTEVGIEKIRLKIP